MSWYTIKPEPNRFQEPHLRPTLVVDENDEEVAEFATRDLAEYVVALHNAVSRAAS